MELTLLLRSFTQGFSEGLAGQALRWARGLWGNAGPLQLRLRGAYPRMPEVLGLSPDFRTGVSEGGRRSPQLILKQVTVGETPN